MLLITKPLCSIPWNGQLSAWQYSVGCYCCGMGLYPLSALSAQVFAGGLAKCCGDGREVPWMLLFWKWSSVPVRLVAPVLLAYSLEYETSASVCCLGAPLTKPLN